MQWLAAFCDTHFFFMLPSCCPWCDSRAATAVSMKSTEHTALGSFRTYVGLLRYNFNERPRTYLPTYLPNLLLRTQTTYLPTSFSVTLLSKL